MSISKTKHHCSPGGQTITSGAMPVTPATQGRGFHVNGDGDLAVTFSGGETATLTVKDGMYYPYIVQTFTSFTGTSVVVLE